MNQSQSRRVVEASYIPIARRVLTAKRLRDTAAEEHIAAKRSCAVAMNSVKVQEFSVTHDDIRYNVRLARPFGRRVNVRKLYTMVKNGEIPLDDFLEHITIDEDTVKEHFGADVATLVSEDYKKGLDLIFTEE